MALNISPHNPPLPYTIFKQLTRFSYYVGRVQLPSSEKNTGNGKCQINFIKTNRCIYYSIYVQQCCNWGVGLKGPSTNSVSFDVIYFHRCLLMINKLTNTGSELSFTVTCKSRLVERGSYFTCLKLLPEMFLVGQLARSAAERR